MNMKKDGDQPYARWPIPTTMFPSLFPACRVAAGHVPGDGAGWLSHARISTQMIAQGVAADGTAPAGKFVLQTSSNFTTSVYKGITDLLAERSLNANMVNAPPAKGDGLMGYFSGGIYSGLTPDTITGCTFLPGAIADIAQSFGAAANNFDESAVAGAAAARRIHPRRGERRPRRRRPCRPQHFPLIANGKRCSTITPAVFRWPKAIMPRCPC